MIRTLGTDFGHFFLLEHEGEVTLIDAGLPGYRDTLEPAMAEMGRSIDDVKAIVLTHADPDHVGFAGELQQAHGIPVYVHRADSERTRLGRAKHAEGSPLAMLGTPAAGARCATRSPTGASGSPRSRSSSRSRTATSSTCRNDCASSTPPGIPSATASSTPRPRRRCSWETPARSRSRDRRRGRGPQAGLR